MYVTFTSNEIKTDDQYIIIQFVSTISLNVFYLNNVKAFYISLLTSHLFRKVFVKKLMKLIFPHRQIGVEIFQTHTLIATAVRNK